MDYFVVRRVRVRPEFASRYPEMVSGVWMSAAKAARLLRQADPTHRRVQDCACRRLMCDVHFEFRGGRTRQVSSDAWQSRAEYRGPYKLSLNTASS